MITSFSNLSAWRTNESLRRTAGYYLLFICLGLSVAVIGPTLPALADQTHSPVGQMGLLFLVVSGGYTVGTMLGGRVFDRVRGHPILGIAQLVAAALLALMPLTPWLWLLLIVVAGKGIAEGFVNTGANTLLIWTHGEKVSPYMNGLHFFFGLGAFLGPFLVAQVAGVVGGYRWAYWVVAVFGILAGLRLLTLSGSPKPVLFLDSKTNAAVGGRVYYPFVISAMLFLFFYVGAEVAFGGWVYTYALTRHLASAVEAAYLTSGFWLAFTLGRLFSIPLATRLTAAQLIGSALLSCLFILTLMILIPDSSLILWLVAIGLGFCMAPIWPMGFTLAGQSLNLTARVSGIILLGDSFGGMVLPWLVGQVIGAAGPQAMVYLVFGSLVGNLLIFIWMLRLQLTASRWLRPS